MSTPTKPTGPSGSTVAVHPLGTAELHADGFATLSLALDGGVNKIGPTFIEGLEGLCAFLAAAEGLRGVLVRSDHRDFCVGADLDFLFHERDPARVFEATTRLTRALRQLETLKVPVAAVIDGAALGGGCEVALACHARFGTPRALLGLPEVMFGVIPGGGGTQRLPRLIGVQAALELMGAGARLKAPKALAQGLLTSVAPDAAAAEAEARAWLAANPGAVQPWDAPKMLWKDVRPHTEAFRNLMVGAQAQIQKRTAGAMAAPKALLAVVQEGVGLQFDRAVELEGRAFARLATSDEAKDMIRTVWYYRTAAERMEGLPVLAHGEAPDARKAVVLGAGMMGAGLAFLLAQAGAEVVLKDVSDAALEKGLAHVRAEVAGLRGASDAEKAALLGRVRGTLELGPCAGADLVIEAVVESVKVKHAVLAELWPLLAPDALWASNTSALPITELAAPCPDPARFIGMHFFSPVEKMPLIEIIRGQGTDDRSVGRALRLAQRIRKTPIVVGDGYGFYTTRVFAAYILEGVALLAEGVPAARIEHAARQAGMMVPPLQVFDEVTLRLGAHVLDDSVARGLPVPAAVTGLLRAMIAAGRTGKADGAGFYEYESGRRRGTWAGLSALVADAVGPDAPRRAPLADAMADVRAIGERLLLAQAAAAARCLDDGVLLRPQDAEVGALLGLGFAPNTGGPLSVLDRMGLPRAVAALDALAADQGPRFAAGAALRRRAADGGRLLPDPLEG